jgi:hypothetical protein
LFFRPAAGAIASADDEETFFSFLAAVGFHPKYSPVFIGANQVDVAAFAGSIQIQIGCADDVKAAIVSRQNIFPPFRLLFCDKFCPKGCAALQR